MNNQKYNDLIKQREEIDRQLRELRDAAKINTARSDDYAVLKFTVYVTNQIAQTPREPSP